MNNHPGDNFSEYAFKYNADERFLHYFNYKTKYNTQNDYFILLWRERCNKFYKANMDWDAVFPMSDAMQYQSTLDTERPTGYIMPIFKLDYTNHQIVSKEAYKIALNLFDIEEKSKISPKEYTEIGNYRDVLFGQLERQINEVQNIHRDLIDVLKVYYFEFERAIIIEKLKEQSKEQVEIFDNLWEYLKNWLTHILKNHIQAGDSLEKLEQENKDIYYDYYSSPTTINQYVSRYIHITDNFVLYNNKLIDNELLDSLYTGFTEIMKVRERVLETTRSFVSKIAPLESILEDYFLNQKIKSVEEYSVNESLKQENNYGIHSNNRDWIINTYKSAYAEKGTQNAAAKLTAEKYFAEKGLKISISQIYRICGIY